MRIARFVIKGYNHLNAELLVCYSSQGMNKERLDDWTNFDHSNTQLVSNSETHSIYKMFYIKALYTEGWVFFIQVWLTITIYSIAYP